MLLNQSQNKIQDETRGRKDNGIEEKSPLPTEEVVIKAETLDIDVKKEKKRRKERALGERLRDHRDH